MVEALHTDISISNRELKELSVASILITAVVHLK